MIRAIAKTDRVVIVGRGGYVPLAGFTDAIHVRATAPFSVRVDNVMREHDIPARSDAERFVDRRDKSRRAFVARYYGSRWEDSSAFDMAVNVDAFGIGSLADLLAAALEESSDD